MIAPYNTLSTAQNWRDEIKKGDLVDVLDKYGAWNTATVMWVDERRVDDIKQPMCKIGFRQYDPQGDKKDSMGSYFGYSENMDEYIGVHTTKLQKPFTQTKLRDLEGNSVQMSASVIAQLEAKEASSKIISEWEK